MVRSLLQIRMMYKSGIITIPSDKKINARAKRNQNAEFNYWNKKRPLFIQGLLIFRNIIIKVFVSSVVLLPVPSFPGTF